jgi:3-deoxy-manno-octulosonate cytidylyltransferase (CMP-KDO synthetase)
MVVRVCERAAAARTVSRVLVATDDPRIFDAVRAGGHEAVMTSDRHETGTDRLAEVAAGLAADLVVNVQGYEPMIPPSTIDAAVEALAADPSAVVSTTCESIGSIDEFFDVNVVKVALRADGRALYFSRAPIPYPRAAGQLADASTADPALLALCRKHTGLYVYRRNVLLEFTNWPQSQREKIEALEQLRALVHGVKIKVVAACAASTGVDTAEDLERVRELVAATN